MNEASESGIQYEDIPYLSYEYPVRYRKRVRTGTRFVYYRGRRRADGKRQPQVYLGTGVVGEIRPSRRSGRLVCEIREGAAFAAPLPFKDENGDYLEPGGTRSGYYVEGVREIAEEVFEAILSRAGLLTAEAQGLWPPPDSPSETDGRGRGGVYASPGVGREIEVVSRAIVSAFLRDRHRGAEVEEMPTNFPGYDLHTDIPGYRYVEVKGTQASVPRFLISEVERRFGAAHADQYLLAVVYGIDLAGGGHEGIATARAPLGAAHQLAPYQWTGVLQPGADDGPGEGGNSGR